MYVCCKCYYDDSCNCLKQSFLHPQKSSHEYLVSSSLFIMQIRLVTIYGSLMLSAITNSYHWLVCVPLKCKVGICVEFSMTCIFPLDPSVLNIWLHPCLSSLRITMFDVCWKLLWFGWFSIISRGWRDYMGCVCDLFSACFRIFFLICVTLTLFLL